MAEVIFLMQRRGKVEKGLVITLDGIKKIHCVPLQHDCKKNYFSGPAFFVCMIGYAQQNHAVRGKIQSENGETIPFATIHALPPHEQHTVADKNGIFCLKSIPLGVSMTLEAHAIGCKPLTTQLSGTSQNVTLILEADVRVLDQVNITDTKVEVNETTVNRSVIELDRAELERKQGAAFANLLEVARSAGTLAHGLDLQTYTVNLSYEWIHGERWRSVVGSQTQFMQNRFRGFEFLLPRFDSFQTGLFWFTEFTPTQKLTLNVGLRGDCGKHDIRQHLQPLYENLEPTGEFSQRNPSIFRQFGNVSGSLGLLWEVTKQLEFKTNLGSGYRMPTAIELSSNGIHHGTFRHEKGDPDLLPERGIQLDAELGYRSSWFSAVFTPFASYYDQYIYIAPTAFFSRLPSGSQLTWEFRQADSYFWGRSYVPSFSH